MPQLIFKDVLTGNYTAQFDFGMNSQEQQEMLISMQYGSEDLFFRLTPDSVSLETMDGDEKALVNKEFATDTWYTFKCIRSGNTLYGKVWSKGQNEPSTWDIQVSDASISPAGSQFRIAYNINNALGNSIDIDNFILSKQIKMSLSETVVDAEVGATKQLGIQIFPRNVQDLIEWESSDESIVEVEDGLLSFMSAGTATITAKLGSITKSCIVHVQGSPFEASSEGEAWEFYADDFEDDTAGAMYANPSTTIANSVNVKEEENNKYLEFYAKTTGGVAEQSQLYSNIPYSSNYTVRFDFRFGAFDGSYEEMYVSLQHGNGTYVSHIQPSLMKFNVNSVVSTMSTKTFTPGTWFTYRASRLNGRIYVKVWPKGEVEPVEWDFMVRDEGITSGDGKLRLNFYSQSTAGLTFDVDNLSLSKRTNMTLSTHEINARIGDEVRQIEASFDPDLSNYLPVPAVIWSSGDASIATVDNGRIEFKGVGSTTITATIGNITKSCTVNVSEAVKLDSVEITGGNTVEKGNTLQLSVSGLLDNNQPADLSGAVIAWSSDNVTVAAINVESGLVTAVAAGTANITAEVTLEDVTTSAAITVTVTENEPEPVPVLETVRITGNAEMKIGETQTLTVAAIMNDGSPADLTGAEISFSSSNAGVAGVEASTGTVTAVAAGTANITAEVTLGSITTSAAITITVTEPAGEEPGGEDPGDGGEVGGGTTPPSVPVISYDKEASTVSTEIKAQVDSASGTVTAQVNAATVTALLSKAAQEKAETIGIKVAAPAGTKEVEAVLPRDAFKQIADNKKVDVSIDAGFATVIFNEKVVENISSSAKAGDISIGIRQVDTASLTEEVQSRVGDRPVYDFTVKAGNTEISEFGPGGKAEIKIPYTLKPGEKKNSIVAYYIDNSGKLQTVRGKYDDASGMVIFTVKHFSRYAVGYNEVNFSDVESGSRYDEAIGFMAARGIISGTGKGRFDPTDSITRADFLIMVMNTYGIEPDARITDNFADAGNKYYTAYLATAKRLGLVSGTGNNLFAPEKTISKQDTIVILYNILEKLGELPSEKTGETLDSFTDANDIAAYAIKAIKFFTEKGIAVEDGKILAPKANFTRAQVAQLLYNLL